MPVILPTQNQPRTTTPWSLSADSIQIGLVVEGVVGEIGCVCNGELKNDLGSSVGLETTFSLCCKPFAQFYLKMMPGADI